MLATAKKLAETEAALREERERAAGLAEDFDRQDREITATLEQVKGMAKEWEVKMIYAQAEADRIVREAIPPRRIPFNTPADHQPLETPKDNMQKAAELLKKKDEEVDINYLRTLVASAMQQQSKADTSRRLESNPDNCVSTAQKDARADRHPDDESHTGSSERRRRTREHPNPIPVPSKTPSSDPRKGKDAMYSGRDKYRNPSPPPNGYRDPLAAVVQPKHQAPRHGGIIIRDNVLPRNKTGSSPEPRGRQCSLVGRDPPPEPDPSLAGTTGAASARAKAATEPEPAPGRPRRFRWRKQEVGPPTSQVSHHHLAVAAEVEAEEMDTSAPEARPRGKGGKGKNKDKEDDSSEAMDEDDNSPDPKAGSAGKSNPFDKKSVGAYHTFLGTPTVRTSKSATRILNAIVPAVPHGYDFSKCLMDGGASLNIMYLETLERMNLTKEQLKHSNTEFHGVVPEKITFEVVPFKSSYHVIFGRPTYHKFHERATSTTSSRFRVLKAHLGCLCHLDYLIDQKLPEDEVLARQIVRRARSYTIVDGQLYKRSFYWLTAKEDADKIVKTCRGCQYYATQPNAPAQELKTIPITWPFAVWGLDMVGKLKRSSPGGFEYLLVAVDKFSKWIEAKPELNHALKDRCDEQLELGLMSWKRGGVLNYP
ncbi:hypothetical protein QYE76_003030 [Lolium multiflorum]|uniref:Integrase zinc-binding domain-containing protein n=1 Tax=Lolium multiflorum TaxID=4521 RepID=A0AAD8RNL1_LOLMU|nr:hypothetical protein QYE76_003030 [Lolium multiflorum]